MILKAVLAVLAAVLANVLIVTLSERGLTALFPPAPGLDLNDPAQLKAFAQSMPVGALATLLAGWSAGAFGSALAGYLVARRTWAAWVGPMFNLLGVVMSITMIPHPLWVAVIGLIMPFVSGWSVPRLLARKAEGPEVQV
ncbi:MULTISPECIES: hypothetical protein [unclassified Caulobacter]|uniref:hypothetical protein n=1 Tax=unclassified Caulobacter TaxID=2648921 RepID=UPI000D336E57|nr:MULTISPECIES: hypothetical protein [unclassified Caulobacter]PTS84520.1 hypothetical protein DBR21_15795 [Caulobacter sp. HMWF009]PTT08766.1 hypothetical protein DBR10_08445 [Caulobacter sp. HMWF025]